jgi:hypothetical protein
MAVTNVRKATERALQSTPPEDISDYFNYRVRNIPTGLHGPAIADSLKKALRLHEGAQLRIGSIVPDLEYKDRQVATISLSGKSDALILHNKDGTEKAEWTVGFGASNPPETQFSFDDQIRIDTHFLDFTPLNCPDDNAEHKFDLIALTGLGGHAFGSFKERDGPFMWLRDGLPRVQSLAGARVIIYGYNAKMVRSNSFQGLGAIATAFKDRLKGFRRHTVDYVPAHDGLLSMADTDIG